MHYYRSNQSALMTRCGTDLRHQYGMFCGESQTSFTRSATRVGSEGRLLSQANTSTAIDVVWEVTFNGKPNKQETKQKHKISLI